MDGLAWTSAPREKLQALALGERLMDEELVDAMRLPPPAQDRVTADDHHVPTRVSLRRWQSPNKFQLHRGTGYAFATTAAMEAALQRSFGRLVDLSEHYLVHVYKASDPRAFRTAQANRFDTGTSLIGFRGNSNAVEAAYRMAIPLESSAPYLDQARLLAVRRGISAANPAPGADELVFASQRQLDEFEWNDAVVPLAARHSATFRVTGFHRVSANALDVQNELAAGREVVMDIPNHTLLVIGYDTDRSLWEIKNSRWDNAPIWVPFGSTLANFLGGYAIDGVEQLYSGPHPAWLGRWSFRIDGSEGDLFIHRTTDRLTGIGTAGSIDGESTATLLGQAYFEDGAPRDVNGWVEDGGRRLVMFVAPDSRWTKLGARFGERVEVELGEGWLRAADAPAEWGGRVELVRPHATTLRYARVCPESGEGREVGHQPAITSWGAGRLAVFLGCRGGFVHTDYGQDGWSGWAHFGGARGGLAAGVGAWQGKPSGLDLFLVDERGRLQHGWRNAAGWRDWDDLGGGLAPGFTAGAVGLPSGRLRLYAISSSGGLVSTSYEPALGWQDWITVDEPGTQLLTSGVGATADPDGTRWLTSVDAATRRPLIRRFEIDAGWGPWTELMSAPTTSVPAVTVTQNVIHQVDRPRRRTTHVFWLLDAPSEDGQLVYARGSRGVFRTSRLRLGPGNPVGVAATSWGAQRLDCVIAQEHPEGDHVRVSALDHLWSDDAGRGFEIETLQIE
ncbi:MAG: hypothetical protein WAS07_12585 [Micropruina sp.]